MTNFGNASQDPNNKPPDGHPPPHGQPGDRYRSCPSYVPMAEELEELTRFRLKTLIEWELWIFQGCSLNSSDLYQLRLCRERLAELRNALGEEEYLRIDTEIREHYRRQMGDRDWRIFTTGTYEEREAVREEFHRQLAEADPGPPAYAVNEIAKAVVERLPEMPAEGVAQAMERAVRAVRNAEVRITPCDHDWRLEGHSQGPTFGGFLIWDERCMRCRALRHLEVPASR